MWLPLLVACVDVSHRGTPPPDGFAVHGIDVSHHQGWIDWSRVAESGRVDFAFVKATEGRTHTDRRFNRNWREARKYGVPVSAYHYLSLCRGGIEQAEHFLSVVPDQADLPLVVDVEPDRRCNRGARLGSVHTVVEDFLGEVEAERGVRPMVYTSSSFQASHLSGVTGERWLAAYSRRPTGTWTYWQYTDNAAIPGVLGPVDGNVYAGSPEDFEALRDGG